MTVYRDSAGRQYRPAGTLPYSELTRGTPYALPGEAEVHFRAPCKPPSGELARVLGALYHRTVIVLEPLPGDGGLDRLVWLVDDDGGRPPDPDDLPPGTVLLFPDEPPDDGPDPAA